MAGGGGKKNIIGLAVLIVLTAAVIYKTASTKEAVSSGIGSIKPSSEGTKPTGKEEIKVFEESANGISAWVVYWDLKAEEEVRILNKELKNLSYFAVSFDSNNNLVMPKEINDYYNKTKGGSYNKFITIVNDKQNENGSFSLKDTNLLRELLSNAETRSRHVKEIINLAVKYGFNGIDIDYEQIKNDLKLWKDYILFIEELYEKAGSQGLKVRVILEPNTPFDKVSFKEGPTYVMMCYNLHGGFSKPGEKANREFIKDLIEKMNKVPGKKDFAIATGGFDWESNGKAEAVSEIQAKELLKKHGLKAQRDANSQTLYFKYKNEKGIQHEVWYADKETLKSWMRIIAEKGHDISLWRLSGNIF
jgi:spore germination protein YaaH